MKKLFVGIFMIALSGVLSAQNFDVIRRDFVKELYKNWEEVTVTKDRRDTAGRVTNMLLIAQVYNQGAAHQQFVVRSWTYENGSRTSVASLVGKSTLDNALRRALRKCSGLFEESEWNLSHTEFYLSGRGIHAYFPPYSVGPFSTGVVHVKLDILLP